MFIRLCTFWPRNTVWGTSGPRLPWHGPGTRLDGHEAMRWAYIAKMSLEEGERNAAREEARSGPGAAFKRVLSRYRGVFCGCV